MNHAFTVEPGAEFPVMAGGDFVFCNFAAHDIRVIIQDSPRTMRAGSKWRPAGGFVAGDLIVKNPDPVNPVAVVLTIGTGDFDDQIIRGEVTVNPGIRNAAGQFVDDTRRDYELRVSVSAAPAVEYEKGDFEQLGTVANPDWLTYVPETGVMLTSDKSPDYVYETRLATGERRRVEAIEAWTDDTNRVYAYHRGLVWAVADGAANTVLRGLDAVSYVPRVILEVPIQADYFGAVTGDGDFIFICYEEAGTDAPTIAKVDMATGKVVAKVSGDFDVQWDAFVVVNGKLHAHDAGNGGVNGSALFTTNLVPVEFSSFSGPEWEIPSGWKISNLGDNPRRPVVVDGGTSNEPYGRLCIKSYEASATGRVIGCLGSAIRKLDQYETDAAVTHYTGGDGRQYLTGQVIKAVLDFYYGAGFVGADYMNHIYAVQFEQANGVRPYTVTGGGQPLSVAGVEDRFQAVPVPSRIIITASAGLKPE